MEAVVNLRQKLDRAKSEVGAFAPVDMSFVNRVILVNDVDRLSRPFVDRCQVVRLPPPSVAEITQIATREIERRGLEPELVAVIATAVRKGRTTSLCRLHKLVDAASAASARPSSTKHFCKKPRNGLLL